MKDKEGKTAMDHALAGSHKEIVASLTAAAQAEKRSISTFILLV